MISMYQNNLVDQTYFYSSVLYNNMVVAIESRPRGGDVFFCSYQHTLPVLFTWIVLVILIL
jgi:hypothetical protein